MTRIPEQGIRRLPEIGFALHDAVTQVESVDIKASVALPRSRRACFSHGFLLGSRNGLLCLGMGIHMRETGKATRRDLEK